MINQTVPLFLKYRTRQRRWRPERVAIELRRDSLTEVQFCAEGRRRHPPATLWLFVTSPQRCYRALTNLRGRRHCCRLCPGTGSLDEGQGHRSLRQNLFNDFGDLNIEIEIFKRVILMLSCQGSMINRI